MYMYTTLSSHIYRLRTCKYMYMMLSYTLYIHFIYMYMYTTLSRHIYRLRTCTYIHVHALYPCTCTQHSQVIYTDYAHVYTCTRCYRTRFISMYMHIHVHDIITKAYMYIRDVIEHHYKHVRYMYTILHIHITHMYIMLISLTLVGWKPLNWYVSLLVLLLSFCLSTAPLRADHYDMCSHHLSFALFVCRLQACSYGCT